MTDKLTFIGTYIGVLTLAVSLVTASMTYVRDYIANDIIKDKWDNERALTIINSIDRRLNLDKVQHLKYLSGKEVYIVSAYVNNGSCHGCGVDLSFFEFEKIENDWKLSNKFINVFEDRGSWGEPPEIKFFDIGYDIYGIMLENQSSGQGVFNSHSSIYSIINGKFKNILDIDPLSSEYKKSSGSDRGTGKGCEEWKTDIKIYRKGTFYYDIGLHAYGIVNCNKFNSDKKYQFNGEKYVTPDSFILNGADVSSKDLEKTVRYFNAYRDLVTSPKK